MLNCPSHRHCLLLLLLLTLLFQGVCVPSCLRWSCLCTCVYTFHRVYFPRCYTSPLSVFRGVNVPLRLCSTQSKSAVLLFPCVYSLSCLASKVSVFHPACVSVSRACVFCPSCLCPKVSVCPCSMLLGR